jgi:hypothetical protein
MRALPLLLLLLGCGHSVFTDDEGTTPQEAQAIYWVKHWAAVKKVDVVVHFTDTPQVIFMWPDWCTNHGKPVGCTANAAAWTSCNSKEITWWRPYLQQLDESTIRSYAAHEVCHAFYKDCGAKATIEARAELCALELILG